MLCSERFPNLYVYVHDVWAWLIMLVDHQTFETHVHIAHEVSKSGQGLSHTKSKRMRVFLTKTHSCYPQFPCRPNYDRTLYGRVTPKRLKSAHFQPSDVQSYINAATLTLAAPQTRKRAQSFQGAESSRELSSPWWLSTVASPITTFVSASIRGGEIRMKSKLRRISPLFSSS